MTQVFDRRRVPIRRVRLEVGTLGLVRNTAGHRTQTKLVCLEHQRSISPLPPPPRSAPGRVTALGPRIPWQTWRAPCSPRPPARTTPPNPAESEYVSRVRTFALRVGSPRSTLNSIHSEDASPGPSDGLASRFSPLWESRGRLTHCSERRREPPWLPRWISPRRQEATLPRLDRVSRPSPIDGVADLVL